MPTMLHGFNQTNGGVGAWELLYEGMLTKGDSVDLGVNLFSYSSIFARFDWQITNSGSVSAYSSDESYSFLLLSSFQSTFGTNSARLNLIRYGSFCYIANLQDARYSASVVFDHIKLDSSYNQGPLLLIGQK